MTDDGDDGGAAAVRARFCAWPWRCRRARQTAETRQQKATTETRQMTRARPTLFRET